MNLHIPPALARRLAGMQANSKLAEAGRKLVQEGVVTIQGFPEAEVDLFSDWAANPFGSRSWQWGVAAFRFLPSIIAHHANSADDAALRWAIDALRSWQQAVKGKLRKYEFAQNDHAVANQAENLIYLLAHMKTQGVATEDWEEIASAIHRHASLLATKEFYSQHTNHGIEQARILGVIGDFFPDHPHSPKWIKLAVKRLSDELDFAFTKEGVHVENSPGYHCYVCLSFLKILDYFPRDEIAELADRIDELMPRAIRFLTHIVRPDGTLPIIGDTVAERPKDYFRRYRKTRDYTYFSYAISDGKAGVRPPPTNMFYPQAGYFIVRDAWQRPGEGRQAFHLVFRCGYRSNYHRHDDDLNLILYCGGEDWLLDSGAYSYAERDPIRRYVRSKWGHNVPVVSTPSEDRWRWSPPISALPLVRLPSAADELAVRGISHSYPNHLAARDLRIKPEAREFIVTDSLVQVERPKRNQYMSLWHVPIDKEILIDDQKVVLTSKKTGSKLEVDNVGPRAVSISTINPEIEGEAGAVVSSISNEVQPVNILAFEWSGAYMHSALRFRWLEPETNELDITPARV